MERQQPTLHHESGSEVGMSNSQSASSHEQSWGNMLLSTQ